MIRAALLLAGVSLLCGCAGCAGPVNPSFHVTPDEAREATRQMRENPRPLERPLVIIGGFLDLNVSPPLFKNHFRELTRDDRILAVSVGSCGSFEACRKTVIEAVDRAYPSSDPVFTTEVDVVGASLGGLVGRYAAAPSSDPRNPRRLKIATLFTISSPHTGASLARVLGFTDFHRDMRPGSAFIEELARHDAEATYVVVPYVMLRDEWVGQENAAPRGTTPWWLAPPALALSPHGAAMGDSRILADIGRRLRGEPPFTIAPRAPFPAQRFARSVSRANKSKEFNPCVLEPSRCRSSFSAA